MEELGRLEQYFIKYRNHTFNWADARKLLEEPLDLNYDLLFKTSRGFHVHEKR